MGNVIGLIITVLLVVGAIVYVVRSKKRGHKCIGCPNGCRNSKTSCSCCNGCDSKES